MEKVLILTQRILALVCLLAAVALVVAAIVKLRFDLVFLAAMFYVIRILLVISAKEGEEYLENEYNVKAREE